VSTSWNGAEQEALRCCRWMARVLYLMGIRVHMDYATGWVGICRTVSYRGLQEVLDLDGRSTEPDPPPTKRRIQRALEELERAGLIEWQRGASAQVGLVFRCLLADWDESVRNKAVPKRYPSGTQQAVPSNASSGAGFAAQAVPKRYPSGTQQAVPPPVSGVKAPIGASQEGAVAPGPADARGARLTLADLPDTWRQWASRERPDLDADQVWARFRDHWAAEPGAKGRKLDWMATWRNWVRRERRGVLGARKERAQAVADSNAELMRRYGGGDTIDGDCRHEPPRRRAQR
jgi:hypothetical protein